MRKNRAAAPNRAATHHKSQHKDFTYSTLARQVAPESQDNLIVQCRVVAPKAWASVLSDEWGASAASKILNWEARWSKPGFVPLVLGWPDGEHCYVVFRCSHLLPVVALDAEILKRAYRHASSAEGHRVLVIDRVSTVEGIANDECD